MNRKIGAALAGVVAVGAVAGGMFAFGSGDDKPTVAVAHGAVQDSPSDAKVADGSGAVPPQADITTVSAERRPDGIAFSLQVREPADPLKDPNWAAGASYITWEVDYTGDGDSEFDVAYEVKDGKLLVSSDGTSPNGQEWHCPYRPASFDPATGYSVVLPAACFGDMKDFTYRGTIVYSTDAANEQAPDVTDVAPDTGMAAPTK